MEYKIEVTEEMLKQLKPHLKDIAKIESEYYKKLNRLEKKIAKELKIEDLEIIYIDGTFSGFGNYGRTMRLINVEEILNGKIIKKY